MPRASCPRRQGSTRWRSEDGCAEGLPETSDPNGDVVIEDDARRLEGAVPHEVEHVRFRQGVGSRGRQEQRVGRDVHAVGVRRHGPRARQDAAKGREVRPRDASGGADAFQEEDLAHRSEVPQLRLQHVGQEPARVPGVASRCGREIVDLQGEGIELRPRSVETSGDGDRRLRRHVRFESAGNAV
ncbi:hypothetical protein FRIGORI9N_180020 [Frigoribacterium sp. 9N]|nr:hypothetical protein FRIGORI9N_180020 [Frigoribacterium sp. 9N]